MRINWVKLLVGVTIALLISTATDVVTSVAFGDQVGEIIGVIVAFIGGSTAMQLSWK